MVRVEQMEHCFRDEERAKTFSSEHTGYLKGEALAENLKALDIEPIC